MTVLEHDAVGDLSGKTWSPNLSGECAVLATGEISQPYEHRDSSVSTHVVWTRKPLPLICSSLQRPQ